MNPGKHMLEWTVTETHSAEVTLTRDEVFDYQSGTLDWADLAAEAEGNDSYQSTTDRTVTSVDGEDVS
jgi:hypothetical protein